MMNKSYRGSFGLPLPPEGTEVYINWMSGSNFSIIWPECLDGENIIYMWINKKVEAKAIIKKHNWIEI